MKVIALEEHFVTPDVIGAWNKLDPALRDIAQTQSTEGEAGRRLLDLDAERVAAMDVSGVDVSVLSLTAPGLQSLEPNDAVALQGPVNDLIAATVAKRPDCVQGFATLATPAPDAAAKELERAVTKLGLDGAMLFGRTRELNLDSPEFWPIFEAAAALKAPLYLHPQSPLPAVRAAYYEGFGDALDAAFATFGIGWHYETGIQFVRLVFAGVFDRFPDLQVIVGHWGEVVLFYLDRMESMRQAGALKLKRPLADYVRANAYVTPSGMLNARYRRWAAEVIGADRLMFATDYPYLRVKGAAVSAFFYADDFAETDRAKIASGNWDRLRGAIRR
jgi:uncharacterized protein